MNVYALETCVDSLKDVLQDIYTLRLYHLLPQLVPVRDTLSSIKGHAKSEMPEGLLKKCEETLAYFDKVQQFFTKNPLGVPLRQFEAVVVPRIAEIRSALKKIEKDIKVDKQKKILKELLFANGNVDEFQEKIKKMYFELIEHEEDDKFQIVNLHEQGLMVLKEYVKELHSKERIIPTGFPALDAALDGGLELQRIGMLLAPTGQGKSLFLLNVGWHVFKYFNRGKAKVPEGYDRAAICYITNENTVQESIHRLSRIATNKAIMTEGVTADGELKPEIIYALEKTICVSERAIFGIMYAKPYSVTMSDIYAEVTNWGLQYNAKPVLVIVDYADRLACSVSVGGKDSEWRQLGYIVDEMKNVAVMGNFIVLTVSQVQREAYQLGGKWGVHNIARSILKLESADYALMLKPLGGLDSDLPYKPYLLEIGKNRRGSTGGFCGLVLDKKTLRFHDRTTTRSDYVYVIKEIESRVKTDLMKGSYKIFEDMRAPTVSAKDQNGENTGSQILMMGSGVDDEFDTF